MLTLLFWMKFSEGIAEQMIDAVLEPFVDAWARYELARVERLYA